MYAQRLCSSFAVNLLAQAAHVVGSSIRPRSQTTIVSLLHDSHWNTATLRSEGSMGLR